MRHYRERGAGIRYWEVGNEPDIGEDGGCPYRFKPESYVRYYRHTAAAILRADPEARVGGPALANVRSPLFPALLDSATANATPLHFVSWHIYSSDPKAVRGTIDYAHGLLKKHPALKPETFLDEWNMDLMNPPLDPRFQPCYVAEVIWQMKDAGLDYSCYYHIRDWYVDFDKFAGFMSPHGHGLHGALVEPHAAVRRVVRLSKPRATGLFHLQAALPAGGRAVARHLQPCGGARICHPRREAAHAEPAVMELSPASPCRCGFPWRVFPKTHGHATWSWMLPPSATMKTRACVPSPSRP